MNPKRFKDQVQEIFALMVKLKKPHIQRFWQSVRKRIRTPGLLIRSQTLYPTELCVQKTAFFCGF